MTALDIFRAVLALLQALSPVLALWLIGRNGAQQAATGAQAEAGKVSAATATTEAAIAQAEANAPTTKAAILDRFKAGTF